MSDTKFTDDEVHELVIQRIKSMTREEWQTRLDAAAGAFGRKEPAVTTQDHNGSRAKSGKQSKKVLHKVA